MDWPNVRRGEVWWVSLDLTVGSETKKRRPCVIVQREAADANSPTTIVCPVTEARGRKAGITNVAVRSGEAGLKKQSVVVCSQLRAIDRSRLGGRLG